MVSNDDMEAFGTTYYPFSIRKSSHRCHSALADIAFFSCVSYIAGSAIAEKPAKESPNIILDCRAADVTLLIHTDGFNSALISGIVPDEILMRSRRGILPSRISPGRTATAMYGVTRLSKQVYSAAFSNFCELAIDWIKTKKSTNYGSWPPVANFCRVVRNALVHGGSINISGPDAPAVSWESVEYSHKQKDTNVLGPNQLSVGDLVFLMFDLNNELDEFGAPFDLS